MSEKSSLQSKKYLEKLGVRVLVNTLLKEYDGNSIMLNDGKQISSGTVIWAAGIKGNIPGGIDKDLIARGNRIKTDRHCKVMGLRNILCYWRPCVYGNAQISKWSPAGGAGCYAAG